MTFLPSSVCPRKPFTNASTYIPGQHRRRTGRVEWLRQFLQRGGFARFAWSSICVAADITADITADYNADVVKDKSKRKVGRFSQFFRRAGLARLLTVIIVVVMDLATRWGAFAIT